MRFLPVTFTCLFCLVLTDMFSQADQPSAIHLEIGTQKPISIVFSSPIVSVDNKNEQVITQISAGKDALQIKVGDRFFPESGMEVVTADGQHHHFVVNYCHKPYGSKIRTPYITRGEEPVSTAISNTAPPVIFPGEIAKKEEDDQPVGH